MRSAGRGNIAMLFFLLFFIFYSVVGVPVMMMIYGPSILVISSAVYFVGMFVPIVVYFPLTKQKVTDVIPLAPFGVLNVFYVIVISFCVLPMMYLISYLTSFVFTPMEMEFGDISLFVGLFAIGVLPSIFEELWFRGIMFHEYSNGSVRRNALVTGLFFGLIHMNFHQAIYAAAMGILMTYLVYYTRTILAPILMHFIVNSTAVFLLHFSQPVDYMEALAESPSQFLLVLGVLSLVLTPVVLICFAQLREHRKSVMPDEDCEPVSIVPIAPAAPKEPTFTWAFWVVVALALFAMVLVEVFMRWLMPLFTPDTQSFPHIAGYVNFICFL